MTQKKVYDKEFKIQAVKLGREIGFGKAAKELGVNIDTLYGWNKRAERTVYRIMERIGLGHKSKCKPNGITKQIGMQEIGKSDKA